MSGKLNRVMGIIVTAETSGWAVDIVPLTGDLRQYRNVTEASRERLARLVNYEFEERVMARACGWMAARGLVAFGGKL